MPLMKPGDRSPWQALPLVFLLLVGIALLYTSCAYYESKGVEEASPRYVDSHGNPLPSQKQPIDFTD